MVLVVVVDDDAEDGWELDEMCSVMRKEPLRKH